MSAFPKTILVILVALALLVACAPAQVTPSTEEIQAQVASAVAMTVAAQANLTAQAQAAASETPAPTELPTLTPILPSVTPFTFVPPPGGSGVSSAVTPPAYSCVFTELRPRINIFKPGDPFDILWLIKNTGYKTWPSNFELNFVSGTHMTTTTYVTLPALKYGETTTVSFDANAPTEPGFYEMMYKGEGGLCFPNTDIEVGKPTDP